MLIPLFVYSCQYIVGFLSSNGNIGLCSTKFLTGIGYFVIPTPQLLVTNEDKNQQENITYHHIIQFDIIYRFKTMSNISTKYEHAETKRASIFRTVVV